jgi:hypothetical protein
VRNLCGAEFRPKAVRADLDTAHEFVPVCEVCLSHLARRTEDEAIPADWDTVYAEYLAAVSKYPEPVFPSVEALMQVEERDPHWIEIDKMAAL